MKTLKFKCELLSDVILNQKAASEGPNKTLDFIPGSCFLGIVANALYKENSPDTWEIVHSGNVRFGDAHPAFVDDKGIVSKRRSVRIPSSYYYPKALKANQKKEANVYIFHKTPIMNFQPVQMRNEFYDIKQKANGSVEEIRKVDISTSFAIKSDYDSDLRRSEDEKMFGYESLQKGLVTYFEVECDENYESLITNVLTSGQRRIGRSRTAQYGLVKISPFVFDDIVPSSSQEDYSLVYADSRLIFIDEFGLPNFQPTAKDLGFGEDDEIDWSLSQVRTFQYSPRNHYRNCFDATRCGIEKGSVIVVKNANAPTTSQYVGDYKSEGFGKVIYNPSFLLQTHPDGKCRFQVFGQGKTPKKKLEYDETKYLEGNKVLLPYLIRQKEGEKLLLKTYKLVNDKVEEWKKSRLFHEGVFRSQFGTIRSIAMRFKTKKELIWELYDPENLDKAYLTHGVAKQKWEEKGRLDAFIKFVEETKLNEDYVQIAIINLASQMQKVLKEDL